MTNQAAQTMPELPDPAFVTPDDNLYTVHQMRAMYQQGCAAALSQTAGVVDGYVLVPARMELTPENMETLVFMLGGDPDAKDADERWNGGTLWVGETIGDNGEKYYGLNVANVECYEEGSVPIVEFASAPAARVDDRVQRLIDEARRCAGSTGDLSDLRAALMPFEGDY